MIFLMGLTMPMRVFVGYIFAMEFLPMNKTQMATALTLGFDGLGIAVAAFWFLYISKDWKTLISLSTVFCYVTALFVCCALPESPKFLVSRGRYDEARRVIDRMKQYNRLPEFKFDKGESSLAAQCVEQGGIYTCLWEEEARE